MNFPSIYKKTHFLSKISMVFMLLLGAFYAHGQKAAKPVWYEKGENKGFTFYDVQKDFTQYWEGKTPKKGQGYKPFLRWADYMAPRVFPSGNMTLPSTNYERFLEWYQQNGAASKLSPAGMWTVVGPITKPSGYDAGVGRVDFVRFDPNNSSIMYVGTPDGGLWKSINGGTSWTTNTDFLPVIGCADLAIDPTNTQIMYLATGSWEADKNSAGILKSTDGGTTWNTTGLVWAAVDDWRITKLLMDPTNPLIMIATTNGGTFKTIDGWATFTTGSFPPGPSLPALTDMEFKPGDPNTIYAAGTTFWKSTDKGDNWTKITTGLPIEAEVSRIALGVTAFNTGYVYALIGNENSEFKGLFRSTNSGTSFTTQSTTPNILNSSNTGAGGGGQATHDLAIAVSPTNADELTIGGINQWRSTDGGVQWTLLTHWLGTDPLISGGQFPEPYLHADVQNIEYLPGSSTTFFSTCDGGISKTTDNGVSWTDLSNNLGIAQQTDVALSASSPTIMVTGLQDIGTLKNTNGAWSVINGGDGESAFIDRTNELTIVSSNPNGAHSISFDGGPTYDDITGLPVGTEFFSPIIQDPVSASTVYAGGRPALYRSTNLLSGGAYTWTTLGTPSGTGSITRLVVAPSNNQIIYTLKSNAVSKSTDGGTTWTNITGTLPVGSAQIRNITVSNTDADKVWVVFSGYSAVNKVFKTTNGGTAWTDVFSAGLPNIPINTIVYRNNSANDEVYIGADIGVYVIDNTLPAWTPFFTDLARSTVNDLEIYYPTGKIRAATYGRGTWESDLYSLALSCPANFSLCLNAAPLTLTGATPVGGTYSGPGVSAGVFTPATAGVGMHTITYTNGGTCTFVITVNALPTAAIAVAETSGTANNDGAICTGASATLTASGGTSYAWSNMTTGAAITVSPTTTTTYTVTVTNGNGCTATATSTITVNPLPTAAITVAETSGTANNDGTICTGASATLTASGGTSYAWSNMATSAAITVSPTTTNTYTVTVTNGNGCTATATSTITVNPLPVVTCPGNASVLLTDPAFALTGATPSGGTYSGTGVSAGMFNPATAGLGMHIITYTFADANSCSNTCTFTITVNNTVVTCPANFSACVNAAPITLTGGMPAGGIYSGPGVSAGVFTPATAGVGMHTITYTNGGTCTFVITVNALPTAAITVAEASGTANNDGTICTGASATLTASGGTSYAWSNMTTGAAITVSPTTTTTYTVTVTNGNGCTATATSTITVNPLPMPSITGPSTVCNAGNVTLNAGAGYTTYAWSNSGGSSQMATFTNITMTTTYTVTVTNANGCQGTATQLVTVITCGGTTTMSGKIVFENDDVTGVKNATVDITGAATTSMLTDVAGDFSMTVNATGNFTIKPVKNIFRLNGVSSADVTRIQQHVLGNFPLSDPYKLVCADINHNNVVSSQDVSLLQQSILGNPAALNLFNIFWRFTPSTPALTLPPWGFAEKIDLVGVSGNQANNNFTGMKIGDVTTPSADPAQGPLVVSPLIWAVQDQLLEADQAIAVTFRAAHFEDLASFQARFYFDPNVLAFVGLETTAAIDLSAQNFGFFNAENGEIRMLWAGPDNKTLTTDVPVFTLKFKSLKSGGLLSDALNLMPNPEIESVAYTADAQPQELLLEYLDVVTSINNPAQIGGLQLLQNRPNPFSGETTIGFFIPRAGEAQLRIIDMSGRLIAETVCDCAAGYHSEQFDLGKQPAGVYSYELTTPFGVIVKKMVKL
jgi:hypothetical protein